MRILLVEDKPDFAGVVEKAILAIDGCELIWKKSRTGALAALADEPFDVVILDRRIPSDDDVLDDHQSHGWDVFQSIKENQPGTSVWFLTGTIDADFPIDVLNDHARNGDIHACGREDSVYQVFWKDKMPDCIAAARAFREDIARTEAIHLNLTGDPVNLRPEEVRLLKLFGRRHVGTTVEARPLTGGLSSARVLRVTVFNAAGDPILTSVAKLGAFAAVTIERDRYGSEIVKLTAGSFPQVTGEIALGASGFAGIFYAIVGTEVSSLFDKLIADPENGALVPVALRAAQANWIQARAIEHVAVAAVRRKLIGDVALAGVQNELHGIDLQPVELVEIEVARCIQHCDLHCGNVLFDDRGSPMLIDYPETSRGFASLDPVSLELSTIFHKDAPDRGGWPSEAQAEQWTDIDTFATGSPFEAYIRACRDWAIGVAASEQEVWAVAYAYALRQLKYHDTDKTLARAIIRSCIARLLGESA